MVKMPALFTSTSMRPWRSTVHSISARAWAASPVSQGMKAALPPSSRIDLRRRLRRASSRMSAITTVGALGGEAPGAGGADAAGRAGHHRDLAFEPHPVSSARRNRLTIWRAISSAESSPGLYHAIDQAMAPISASRKYLRLVPCGSGRSSISRRKTFS